jgi:hypothetical protein
MCETKKDTLFPHHWGGGKQSKANISLSCSLSLSPPSSSWTMRLLWLD